MLVATLVVVFGMAGYLVTRDGTEPAATADSAPAAPELGDGGAVLDVSARPTRFRTLSGLQTTIPETLGYDERTAVYAIEDGGFRVRVMTRKVTDSALEGVVVQQLPRGGITRRVGWIVTIVVGRRD